MKQRLGRVLFTPFPDPNVDSGVITPNAVVIIQYPHVGRSKKSAQPSHVKMVVIIEMPSLRIVEGPACPRWIAVDGR
jgi:hypothetical protein